MFDLKKLKSACPSDLKKEKVTAADKALKTWNDQIPEHAKDCKLKDILDDNVESVTSALGDLLSELVIKKNAKKDPKDKKPYSDCEILVKDYRDTVAKYKKDVELIDGRASGDYQKHLAEVMNGYKTCLEQIIEAEFEMQTAAKVIEKIESTFKGLTTEMKTGAAPKLREALARAEKAIKDVLDKQTNINLQNKERNGPLRQKIVEYKIDPEIVQTGAISKIYFKQAEISNKIIIADNRLKPIIANLKIELGV